MYLLGMWSIGIINLVVLISGIASREGMVIIGVVIFVPIFSIAELVVLRIICEVCVVILLLPYYVAKGDSAGERRRHDEVEVMDDVESQGDGLDSSVHQNKRGGGFRGTASSSLLSPASNPIVSDTSLAV